MISKIKPTRGKHPQWNHGWEVEGGNASTDTQWYSVASEVHILCNASQMFAQQQVKVSTQMLNYLLKD